MAALHRFPSGTTGQLGTIARGSLTDFDRPDPVSFVFLRIAVVVSLVPTHRIEQELTVRGKAILQRLASNDVVRQVLQKAWRKPRKRCGILTIRSTIAFQGTYDEGFARSEEHTSELQSRE